MQICKVQPTQKLILFFLRPLRSLFAQVLFALLLGVLVGLFIPEFAQKLKPLGDGFIKLIKMIIPVLVFCVVVHGIAGAGDLKRVGRVGVKALIDFEVVTTVALGLGLLLAYTFQPGAGMNVDPATLDGDRLRHHLVRQRVAADHGQVAPHGHPRFDRWPGDPDRLLV